MKVLIRTDSSTIIGTGHVMRCLTLAERLRQDGADVRFICRAFDGGAAETVGRQGFSVVSLPFSEDDTRRAASLTGYDRWLGVDWEQDAKETIEVIDRNGGTDWLVVDHYAIDQKWEHSLRPYAGKILVIDDIANRTHDCDVLLDQNHGHDDSRYDALVNSNCRRLLGANYALLRNEFYVARQSAPQRTGHTNRILVFYGGADATNETAKAVKALCSLRQLRPFVDVVIGSANCHADEIRSMSSRDDKVHLHTQVERMSELMVKADLCLGAAGTTTWERCCLGLPTVMTAVAENQISIARAIDGAGAGIYLGTPESVRAEMIREEIGRLALSPEDVIGLSRRATMLVDGLGAQRVAGSMLGVREAALS